MTIVQIDTSPDATVTLQSLVMASPTARSLTLIGNHWQEDLPDGILAPFLDHLRSFLRREGHDPVKQLGQID